MSRCQDVKRSLPYRSLDHVVVKSHDEAVGEVQLELLGELLDDTVKPV